MRQKLADERKTSESDKNTITRLSMLFKWVSEVVNKCLHTLDLFEWLSYLESRTEEVFLMQALEKEEKKMMMMMMSCLFDRIDQTR